MQNLDVAAAVRLKPNRCRTLGWIDLEMSRWGPARDSTDQFGRRRIRAGSQAQLALIIAGDPQHIVTRHRRDEIAADPLSGVGGALIDIDVGEALGAVRVFGIIAIRHQRGELRPGDAGPDIPAQPRPGAHAPCFGADDAHAPGVWTQALFGLVVLGLRALETFDRPRRAGAHRAPLDLDPIVGKDEIPVGAVIAGHSPDRFQAQAFADE